MTGGKGVREGSKKARGTSKRMMGSKLELGKNKNKKGPHQQINKIKPTRAKGANEVTKNLKIKVGAPGWLSC